MADEHPRPGDVGTWGVRAEFDSGQDAADDPRYADHEWDPAAYVRVYISDEVGWVTVFGGIPLDQIDDIIDAYIDRYAPA